MKIDRELYRRISFLTGVDLSRSMVEDYEVGGVE